MRTRFNKTVGYFANGTEGQMFEEAWCANCVHTDLYNIGVDPPCPVWMAHLAYSYELCNEKDHPGKVILDSLIPIKMVKASDGIDVPVNECAMFHGRNGAMPGQMSLAPPGVASP